MSMFSFRRKFEEPKQPSVYRVWFREQPHGPSDYADVSAETDLEARRSFLDRRADCTIVNVQRMG